jgi:hypothetical protein
MVCAFESTAQKAAYLGFRNGRTQIIKRGADYEKGRELEFVGLFLIGDGLNPFLLPRPAVVDVHELIHCDVRQR